MFDKLLSAAMLLAATGALICIILFGVNCSASYQCSEGSPYLRALPDGSAVLTVPCDGDETAVVVRYKRLRKLRVEGYDCVRSK